MGAGTSLFSNDSEEGGRVVHRPKATSRDKRAPPQTYPKSYVFREYGPEVESAIKVKSEDDQEVRKPLEVVGVNLCVERNTREHHCDAFDITEATPDDNGVIRVPQLVVRRGQLFYLTINFDRSYDPDTDELHVLFEIGSSPKESKGTLISMDEPGIRRDEWGFYLDTVKDNDVTIAVKAAPNTIVGIWEFLFHTSIKSTGDVVMKEVHRYIHNLPVYMLFNPWCKEDVVYMEDEVMLDECILNDTGKLYRGSYNQIGSISWNFGQFEDKILDCCMYLLGKSANYQGRGDPIHVVRHISAVVNSQGDRGVLSGNWSGNYKKGTAPTAWVGSVAILESFYKDKIPVKYGQCWVFSAVCTTVCRALGIPCRSVTNFASAHDCDDNITIDKHWDVDGKPLKELNEDSVWNFHVWNEVWMARQDLPTGYGGWQAFDATPQETSGGVYCAGPASVKAIKEGSVNTRYDAAFIFAEVNADRVHWKQQPNGKFKVMNVEKHTVGKHISTHRPRNQPAESSSGGFFSFFSAPLPDTEKDDFRLDLTDNYKFREGSEEERAAVYRAHVNCTRDGEIHTLERGEADVKFELNQKDNVFVGSPFTVTLNMQNTSRSIRTISGALRIAPVYYTGVSTQGDKEIRDIKAQQFQVELQPVKNHEMVMRLTVDDYVDKFLDQVSFEIYVSATVAETSQTHLAIDTYRLRRPDLQLTAPKQGKVGEAIKVKIYLLNPLPLHLTECEWDVEGPGISKSEIIVQKDIDPNDQVEIYVELTPKKAGLREIMASFTSKQLTDIAGSCTIEISKE